MLRAESTVPSPMSPFLSESAHVRSLQYPDVESITESANSRKSEGTLTAPTPEGSEVPILHDNSPSSTDTVTRSPPQPKKSEAGMAMKLCLKTLNAIETRVKGKSPYEQSNNRQLSEDVSPASQTVVNLGTGSLEKTPTWLLNERKRLKSPASETVLNLSTTLMDKTTHWLKAERGKLRLSRKVFRKAPMDREESVGSISTISSSIRGALKGEARPVSPSSSKTVRLMSPITASQYPGGEATRIPTPPLDEDTADGRARGFFTCGTPPSMDGVLQASSPVLGPRAHRNPRSDVYRRSLNGQTKEWWEQCPQRQTRRTPKSDSKGFDFDFDVPDHLPTSPLCPANRKHRSGGTGLCVYHGRSKGDDSAPTWTDDVGE